MTPNRRGSTQRGSALLVVLVFAAIIGIMLYRELPVVKFEAERQKEQLLMDRGNEYKRAIQLYVRKLQNFPPSIDALENTNRMRFLRARYVDPYTGKDDWRLLHAGPGGVITDSKIKQNASSLAGAPGSTGSSAATLGTGSSVTNPFANSFDGANPNGTPGATANSFAGRPPIISANGGGTPTANSDPLANLQAGGSGLPPDPNPANPQANLPPSALAAPGTNASNGDQQNPMQNLLNNQNNPAPVSQNATIQNSQQNPSGAANATTGLGTMNGTTMGAGIAGVASKSPGMTIKVFNDQSDRSLWEFVYDMQKEAMANAPGGTNPLNPAGGTNNSNSTNTGTTGGTGSGSGFPGSGTAGTSSQSNVFQNNPSN